MVLLGVDTGGTFTDFVLLDDTGLRIHKVLSTPDAPERAILQGARELGIDLKMGEALRVAHGSTVATNAALEGKGVRTAFVTNHGFADLLTIGRQARSELYQLQPLQVPPPVPSELCFETGGRIAANGELLEPLTAADLQALAQAIAEKDVQAVAINLLFSFVDDQYEKAIEAALGDTLFISRSSAILPEYREYERGVTTWLNAWVGPLVEGYLQRLCVALPDASVSVMQSSGGTIAASQAGAQAVNMLLSGPAGGLAAARYVAAEAGVERLLTFDMGGTSTDVALIEGELTLTSEGHIGPYPVAVPMVDMHTIGAGGGSIASIDAGGMLQVGPQSAGAMPGPACYGHGGRQATVTDANVVLGRLRAEAFLGGSMSLDTAAAEEAVKRLAGALGMGLEETAQGIIDLANEHMARALRVMSVQRGIDPRELTLTCFGGAGGLHVCALAESLGMHHALVPVNGGVLSALGMLVAPRSRQLSHTLGGGLHDWTLDELQQAFSRLREQGSEALNREGVCAKDTLVSASVDLRYQGQSYYLNLPWSEDREALEEAFHQRHEQRFGHRLQHPLELVNLRVGLEGPKPKLPTMSLQESAPRSFDAVSLYGLDVPVAMVHRDALDATDSLDGPAIIIEQVSTTYLSPGWRCQRHPSGSLLLSRL